jgi:hypothetical protein
LRPTGAAGARGATRPDRVDVGVLDAAAAVDGKGSTATAGPRRPGGAAGLRAVRKRSRGDRASAAGTGAAAAASGATETRCRAGGDRSGRVRSTDGTGGAGAGVVTTRSI